MEGGREPPQASEAARLAVLDRLPEGVVLVDRDARITWANGTARRMSGYELAELVGLSIFDLLHPDDLGYMLSSWEKRVDSPDAPGLIVQARVRRSDGSWLACEAVGVSLLEDPTVGGMVITARDLTRQAALADSPGRMRSMVDRTTDILFLLSADGRFIYANRRLTMQLGHDSDRVVGSTWTEVVHADDVEAALGWFEGLVDGGDGFTSRLTARLVGTADHEVTVELNGTNQLADPLIGGLIVSARDIGDLLDMQRTLEERNERLADVVTHDSLTGLYNRVAFVEAVQATIDERRSAPAAPDGTASEVVVLFCDLDGFKAVNDRFGHRVGDHVLQETAARLLRAVGPADMAARYGGDEFTVLLGTEETVAGVAALAARITSALSAPVTVGGATARIGVSIGVGRAPAATAEVDPLLSAADDDMYRRKTPRTHPSGLTRRTPRI